MTFSGGEPLMQAEALISLLHRCGELGIHRAVDTSGFAPVRTLLEVARHADLFLFDLKHMDSASHTKYTGVSNELILENLVKLAGTGVALRIRLPLLAGINDDYRNLRATAEFTAALPGVQGIDILPYHNLATAKYTRLGEPYRGADRYTPDPESIAHAQYIFEQFGHTVRIGG